MKLKRIKYIKETMEMICRRLAVITAVAGLAASAYALDFSAESQLAEGRWIKIEIPATGLYQIPYSQLLEMGFPEPEKVGVFGCGGRQRDAQFVDGNGIQVYSDRLPAISVMHKGESLYFYGRGTDVVEFRPGDAGTPSRFASVSKNIYSNSAYYFLTDSEPVNEVADSDIASDNTLIDSGLDYRIHELDLYHNRTSTGQLFWGENFFGGQQKYSWKFSTPYAMPGFARLDCAFYMERSYSDFQVNGDFKVGIAEAGAPYSIRKSSAINSKYVAVSFNHAFTHSGAPTSTIEIEATSEDSQFLNLDYWVYNYTKRVPEGALAGDASELYGVKTAAGTGCEVKLAEGLELLDISDYSTAKRGVRAADGSGLVRFIPAGQATEMLIWDPNRPQLAITGWREVKNGNLHSLSGTELLIVSTPALRHQAEALADLHRSHDGINVAVVTPEEIYNEFSGGTPDAIAIRALVKYLYDRDGGKLKNLLLYGPSSGDIRSRRGGREIWDEIIAYQHSDLSESAHAAPVYDYYCMTADRLSSLSQLNFQDVNVGLGILSVENEEECRRVYNKIKRYLEDDNHVWSLSETLTMGGLGNDHAHDRQAQDFSDYIKSNSPEGMCASTISINAYGEKAARQKWIDELNRGTLFNTYFGHGALKMIGQQRTFFTSADIPSLANRYTGLIFMGGCDFSMPDQGFRGLGENFVLDTEHGMIASVISTRTAWSNQNYELGKRLVRSWLKPSDENTGCTLGLIYARCKSRSDYANSLVFMPVGDPALKIPAPLRNVETGLSTYKAAAGERIVVKGKVMNEGEHDMAFTGKAVVKIIEPGKVITSADYVEKYYDSSKKPITLDITYDNNLIAAFETEIRNGEFSEEIVLPAAVANFAGESLPIRIAVFDKSTWTGGAGSAELTVAATPESKEDTQFDCEAPVITANYDADSRRIGITVTDNAAIASGSSAMTVRLNGERAEVVASEYERNGEMTRIAEAYVDMERKAPGTYALEIEATDAAGNQARYNAGIEKKASAAPLLLTLSAKSSVGNVEGVITTAEGNEPAENLVFEIENHEGIVIAAGRCGSSLNIDCHTLLSSPLPEGLYRIRVKGAAEGSRLYSVKVGFALFNEQ